MHVEAPSDLTQKVVSKGYILNDIPGRCPVLVANGEEDGEPGLPVSPVILEDVAVNQYALRVLQLKEVLDPPGRSCVARIANSPRERLEAVVAPELDVRRRQVYDFRIGAAEHKILARALEIVIDDLERARAVPAADRLRISANLVTVGDVRVNDRGRGAVERNAAAQSDRAIAVNVESVQDQVVRHLGQRSLIIAERDQVGGERSGVRLREFQPDQTVVMSAARGLQRRPRVRSNNLGHQRS